MAIRAVLTKDNVYGTYEKTRLGVTAYPNTKKVSAPKYLLASAGGPVYYDPVIDGVSPMFNQNSAICGDLFTVVTCPLSRRSYLVSYEYDSNAVARCIFHVMNSIDIRLALYNPRQSVEWVSDGYGSFVQSPKQWAFPYSSPPPEIDGLLCAPIVALPSLGADTFFVFGNVVSYIVNPILKVVYATFDFSGVNNSRVESFRFSPYSTMMLFGAVSERNELVTYRLYTADYAGFTPSITSIATIVPTIMDMGTYAPSQYPSSYIPTALGWEWETAFKDAGLHYFLERSYLPPSQSYPTFTRYPGYAATRYRKPYTPAASPAAMYTPTSQCRNQETVTSQNPPYLWVYSYYYNAYVSDGYSICGPATIGFGKLDIFDCYFQPHNQSIGAPWTQAPYDSTNPDKPQLVTWQYNSDTMPSCGDLVLWANSYKYKTLGILPQGVGAEMDAIQSICAVASADYPAMVGTYTSDGGYMLAYITAYGAGTTSQSRVATLKDPLGTGALLYGMAPLIGAALPENPAPP